MFKLTLPFSFLLPAMPSLPVGRPKKGRSYEFYYNQALELYQKGRFEACLLYLQEAEAAEPERSETYYTRGVCYQRLSDDKAAKESFQQALMLNPEDSDCLYNIARIFYNEGNMDVSLGYAELAESLVAPSGGDPDIYYLIGLINEHEQRYQDAIQGYQRSLALNPEQMFLGTMIAKMMMKVGMFAQAADYLVEQAEQDPYNMEVNHLLALSLAKIGKWKDSIKYCKRIVQVEPNYAPAYNQLGLAYYSTQNFEDARASYEKALELDPNFITALNNLAYTYEKLQNWQKALHTFTRYSNYIKSDPEEYGEVQHRMEQLKQRIATPPAASEPPAQA